MMLPIRIKNHATSLDLKRHFVYVEKLDVPNEARASVHHQTIASQQALKWGSSEDDGQLAVNDCDDSLEKVPQYLNDIQNFECIFQIDLVD